MAGAPDAAVQPLDRDGEAPWFSAAPHLPREGSRRRVMDSSCSCATAPRYAARSLPASAAAHAAHAEAADASLTSAGSLQTSSGSLSAGSSALSSFSSAYASSPRL